MSLRSVLLLFFTGLYFWLCHYIITCLYAQVCYACQEVPIVQKPIERDPEVFPLIERPDLSGVEYPLVFTKNSPEPFMTEKFYFFKESIYGRMKDENILEITGLYFDGEENHSNFENLGLARAHEIKKLFLDKIPEEKITLRASLVQNDDPGLEVFEAAEFYWINPNEKETAQPERNEDLVKVIETADEAIIYFPYNSTQKELDPEIDAFLNKLAQRLKQSGEKVLLTGHTDNLGGEASNDILGLRRAKRIRNILWDKGVERQQIFTETKGESEPLGPNTTPEGRAQNRRTVVKILNN